MFVKIDRADGCTDLFETNEFMISKPEDMNPIIVKLIVKDSKGKTIAKWKRPNAKNYMRYYKPDPIPAESPKVEVPVADI